MKIGKRLLIMAIAAVTLVSIPAEVKASDTEGRMVLGEKVEAEKAGQLVSEKTYNDENGNQIREKIYVNLEKTAESVKKSSSAISGRGTFRKEQEFLIYTGKTRKDTFMFKNRRATLIRAHGAVTRRPNGVVVTSPKTLTGTNNAKFRFYAKSNFSRKKEYSVRITAAGDGRVY